MPTSKSANNPGASNDARQSIEQLQERYRNLDKKKTRAEADLDNAQKQLQALQTEAREKYGSDDVAALQKKLADMKTENENKRRQYQADLDQIESELQAVDAKFATADGGEGAA